MKFCARHQADVNQALQRKGMWQLVTNDPQEVERRAVLWLQGRASRQEVDPLVVTTYEIQAQALRSVGQYLNSPTVEYCPLCEAAVHFKSAVLPDSWIDNCTDAVLILCHTNGLIKRYE